MLPPHDGTKRRPFHSYQPPENSKPRTRFGWRPTGSEPCQSQFGGKVRTMRNQCSSGTSPLPIAIRLPRRASV